MAERYPDFTPIILLTGFLGSGKTTLLKQILADPAFGDTAVIINEFGEVGLDHHLIEHVADDVVLLPSGCLCCAMKGELAATLRDLQSRRARGAIPAFRRIIVESSGLGRSLSGHFDHQGRPDAAASFPPGNGADHHRCGERRPDPRPPYGIHPVRPRSPTR